MGLSRPCKMGQGSTRVAVLNDLNLLNFCLLPLEEGQKIGILRILSSIFIVVPSLVMPKSKRSVLEGEDDGEGYPWKVVKDKGAAINVMYGKGWDATFILKKDDQKAPTEQLVLQRIAEHRDTKRRHHRRRSSGSLLTS